MRFYTSRINSQWCGVFFIALVVAVRGTNYLTNGDFGQDCPGVFEETVYTISDWNLYMRDPDPFTVLSNGFPTYMSAFTSAAYPDLIEQPGLCFINLYDSCLVQTPSQLNVGKYKLGFRYLQVNTRPETLLLSVIDTNTNNLILEGSPLTVNLRANKFVYVYYLF